MGQLWITGDTHGNITRFSNANFPEQKEFEGTQEENVMLQLGDFGMIWDHEETKGERWWMNWLEERPFTTLFLDGNHDNHPRLAGFPVVERYGGLCHEIRPHVLHAIRGEVYEICGKRIFAFGGASSHDIRDGILEPHQKEKIRKWSHDPYKLFRINGISWWKEELPSQEEMDRGLANLEKYGWEVDYVLSHSPSASVTALIGDGLYEQDILTRYLESIREKLAFKKWFAGHMHLDRAVNDKDILLFEQIVRIG